MSGAAFAIAITNGLWEGHAGSFDPGKGLLVLSTGLLWLFAEFGALPSPSEHDIALFKSIFELAGDREKDLLRLHDFGNGFSRTEVEGLWRLAEWRGVNYHFNDGRLQKRWIVVKAAIDNFSSRISSDTGPKGGNRDWLSAIPDNVHDDFDLPDWVTARTDRLNKLGTDLIGRLEEFQVYGRNRLSL